MDHRGNVLTQITHAVEDDGPTGYSVMRVVLGRGSHSECQVGAISGVLDNAKTVFIKKARRVQKLLVASPTLMRDRVGIVYLSDDKELRAEYF